MRDLVRESGLPASTIHHYIRIGLLPAPERPTSNSARYDQRHLDRLGAVGRIRRIDPDLSLAGVKRVVALVANGVEPEVAVALRHAVTGRAFESGVNRRLCASELAAEVGITGEALERLIALGVVVPTESDDGPEFDVTDAWVVEGAVSLERTWAPGLGAASRVSALIREASAVEMELRNQMVSADAVQAADTSRRLQEWANVWHPYLFSRYRLREIQEFGLGPGLP